MKAHNLCVNLTLALAFIVITLGAYTRLVDAGLGCPDWPGCYGFLVLPTTSEDVEVANQRFSDQPYEVTKAIPEVVHRIVAGSLGVLIAVMLFLAWKSKKPLGLPIAIAILVIFQAALGAWTVTLKLWPQVVTAHLLGGFGILALLFLYALKEECLPAKKITLKKKHMATVFLVVVVGQIALGGWTSANYAALACPDFPLCHGSLVPDMDYRAGFNLLQDIGPNYLGGNLSSDARVAIQVTHRIGAVLVLVFGVWLLVLLPKGSRIHLATLLVCQLTLGILNILMNLPLYIAVLHNLGAALLLLSALQIVFFSESGKESISHGNRESTSDVDHAI